MRDDKQEGLTRRQVLAALGGATVAAAVTSGAAGPGSGEAEAKGAPGGWDKKSTAARMPVVHLPHGGAPWPFVELGFFAPSEKASLTRYHDMRGFGGAGRAASETFDAWLRDAATADPEVRASRLSAWSTAPAGRKSHPREEHLLPLMVIAGAAGADRGRTAWSDLFAGTRISAFHYG